jgi:hypothetical protein
MLPLDRTFTQPTNGRGWAYSWTLVLAAIGATASAACDANPTCEDLVNCVVPQNHKDAGDASSVETSTDGSALDGPAVQDHPSGQDESDRGRADALSEAVQDQPLLDASSDTFADHASDAAADSSRTDAGAGVDTDAGPGPLVYFAELDGVHEVPPNTSTRVAIASVTLDMTPGAMYANFALSVTNFDVAAGPVMMPFADFCVAPPGGSGSCFQTAPVTGASANGATAQGPLLLNQPSLDSLATGNLYVDFRDAAHPSERIRGWFQGIANDTSIAITTLHGSNEVPPNTSFARATARLGLPSGTYTVSVYGLDPTRALGIDFCTGSTANPACSDTRPVAGNTSSGVIASSSVVGPAGDLKANFHVNLQTQAYPSGELLGLFVK